MIPQSINYDRRQNFERSARCPKQVQRFGWVQRCGNSVNQWHLRAEMLIVLAHFC